LKDYRQSRNNLHFQDNYIERMKYFKKFYALFFYNSMFYLYQKSQVLFIKPKSAKIFKMSNKKNLFIFNVSIILKAYRYPRNNTSLSR